MSILNITKPACDATVVVAMSGGVDSSVVAAMLHQAGYKVIGVTLQLYDHGIAIGKKGACCAGQDIYDASRVAAAMGFPHYVLDYESKFKTAVIDDFVESYVRGETPLPCVRCNQSVKFADLLKVAKELGADALATGHYVQRKEGQYNTELHKGADSYKDQSYFLFTTTQEQLNFLHFPLGGLSKPQTREMAKEFGLEVSDKPDSQDICFVPNGSYAELVAKLKPEAMSPGKIVHVDGYEVGTHQGIAHYTIGQRRGLGGGAKEPLYVVSIDPEQKIIYVGSESALEKSCFLITNVNWLGDTQISSGLEVIVKIRSLHSGAFAKLFPQDDGRILVEMAEPTKAVTPGQACVFYDNTRVLGGGWIVRR